MQPNVSAIGKIDLDDTDNVIASADAISVAQEAGTFVGDAAANVIDWNASYNNEDNARMPAGLNYLNGVDTYTEDNYTEADYAMSNIGGHRPALLQHQADQEVRCRRRAQLL